jgi:L-ascorbate metabolism protein UlaG (beta-lactamase superfamily)
MSRLSRAIPLVTPLALGACTALSHSAYHGPVSDHFDGQRFHNYERVGDEQIEDGLRNALHAIEGKRGRWAKWEETPTDTPPARVDGGALRATFVNHATVLLQLDGVNVLVDPVWSRRISPSPMFGPARHRPPGIRFDDLPPIDVVLVSHDHYDHMDLPTLRSLTERFHPRILTGLGNARYLADHGVPGAQEIDWWQRVDVAPGMRVTGVPAQHWSARSLSDKWRRLWLGFVIESVSGPVYVAGDTGLGPFFPMIRDHFARFRLAVLPIAPQRPRHAMAPRHASARDALVIDSILGAGTALAVHFGTFRQGDDAQDEPVDSLRAALAERGPCAPRFWALRNGEARMVPGSEPATLGCVLGATPLREERRSAASRAPIIRRGSKGSFGSRGSTTEPLTISGEEKSREGFDPDDPRDPLDPLNHEKSSTPRRVAPRD